MHEDCAYVDLVQRGDRDAFRALYEKYWRLVYRYIQVRVGDPHDTEDLAAETFIRAWRGIARFACRDKPFVAWTLRIAHNLIADKYRRRRLDVTQWLPWLSAPERQFAHLDQQDEIRRAFNTLSHEQQVILHMHFFEDYGIDEVAAFLGKSPNAVRVAQSRALKRLRDVLTR